MQYYSTNSKHDYVSLRDAIMRSMAHDGGVYMPESIPLIPRALFKNIADMSLTDIAYVAGTVLFGSDIPPARINDIVKETLNFPIPLVAVTPRIFALELFHGPTGSFKDVGARFLARLIRHYTSGSQTGKVNVLVATSGDTGCAVAQGFAGIDNINVFILHPKGRLLRVPSDQFLSPAPNIRIWCAKPTPTKNLTDNSYSPRPTQSILPDCFPRPFTCSTPMPVCSSMTRTSPISHSPCRAGISAI